MERSETLSMRSDGRDDAPFCSKSVKLGAVTLDHTVKTKKYILAYLKSISNVRGDEFV